MHRDVALFSQALLKANMFYSGERQMYLKLHQHLRRLQMSQRKGKNESRGCLILRWLVAVRRRRRRRGPMGETAVLRQSSNGAPRLTSAV
ncbi:hypothetical protein E2C01_023383 [Portunus trituberculatus]|uniref:Uncharacterized protein n=1 Tax=Portunus trituberculatus TaxID=210409 RepID=A0A5B7EBF1_PORTR|nr:hypothetical protein [Portunus trituberculatus]